MFINTKARARHTARRSQRARVRLRVRVRVSGCRGAPISGSGTALRDSRPRLPRSSRSALYVAPVLDTRVSTRRELVIVSALQGRGVTLHLVLLFVVAVADPDRTYSAVCTLSIVGAARQCARCARRRLACGGRSALISISNNVTVLMSVGSRCP